MDTTTNTSANTRRTQVLLACGVLYTVLYAVVNDVLAAGRYDGYDPMSQAVSELSAIGSPARAFLTATFPIWPVLQIAFGIGVRRAAGGRRALRVTAGLLVAHGIVGLVWLVFPMTSRADMAPGAPTAVNDIGHLVLTAATIVFVLSQFAFSAAAFGWRFRVYAVVSAVTVLVFGALTGVEAAKLASGRPTPWMGLFERISIAPWLLWMTVLAVMLLTAGYAGPPTASPAPDRPGPTAT